MIVAVISTCTTKHCFLHLRSPATIAARNSQRLFNIAYQHLCFADPDNASTSIGVLNRDRPDGKAPFRLLLASLIIFYFGSMSAYLFDFNLVKNYVCSRSSFHFTVSVYLKLWPANALAIPPVKMLYFLLYFRTRFI